MTAPCETSGAAPARCSGPSPARPQDAPPLAALERERVRDPDALPAERLTPEPAERFAGAYRPITPKRAARNRRQLAEAAGQADGRTRTTGQEVA